MTLIPRRKPSGSERAFAARFSTGVAQLDKILSGGLPRGQISEIVGTISSGKTGLLLKILAGMTGAGERVAYIDPFYSFDPVSAAESGLLFSQFLWIRSQAQTTEERLEQALKAVDILTRSETFCLIALDLEKPRLGSSRIVHKIPFNSWFRIKKTLQGKAISLLVLNTEPSTGSAAAVVLGLERCSVKWKVAGNRDSGHPGHARLLRGLCSEVRLLRGKHHGRITLHCSL